MKVVIKCLDCKTPIHKDSTRCRKCFAKSTRGRKAWNSDTAIQKYCLDCKKPLHGSSNYIIRGKETKRCRECNYIFRYTNFKVHPNSLKALFNPESRKKVAEIVRKNPPFLGLKHSTKSRKLISKHRKGKMMEETNHKWEGDNVQYGGLHSWVARRLGKPDTCEFCGESGISGKKINWANKSGLYKRDLKDWLRLCKSCHAVYDNTGNKAWETRRLYAN